MTDLRDPKLLGETLIYWARNQGCKLTAVRPALLKVADHSADPTPLEKYGRPQDLPSTLPN